MSNKEDEHILAGLTEEERAAFLEPDDEDPTATQGELEEAAKAATNDGSDDEDTNKGTDGNDDGAAPAADAGAAAAKEPVAAKPADTGADEQGQSASTQPQAPIYVAEVPADADAKLADIATRKEKLLAEHDEGDITTAEYGKQLDALAKEERIIERAMDRAQIAQEMEQQRQKNQWDNDCNGFLETHKALYTGDANLEAFAHLNETIIAFAKMPRNAGLSGPALLDKAHKAVMAERGTPVASQPGAKPKPGAPKPTLPPDMSRIPSASSNDPGEGKYASLDRLQSASPEAYEKALANMSEAERDAYLAA